eukprot:scaffold175_cov414-Prasinococcus_capsulatus_cf.AAC.41
MMLTQDLASCVQSTLQQTACPEECPSTIQRHPQTVQGLRRIWVPAPDLLPQTQGMLMRPYSFI